MKKIRKEETLNSNLAFDSVQEVSNKDVYLNEKKQGNPLTTLEFEFMSPSYYSLYPGLFWDMNSGALALNIEGYSFTPDQNNILYKGSDTAIKYGIEYQVGVKDHTIFKFTLGEDNQVNITEMIEDPELYINFARQKESWNGWVTAIQFDRGGSYSPSTKTLKFKFSYQ